MKKSAIKDIFYGFRGHMETMHIPKDYSDSAEKADKADKAYEELKEKLSAEQLSLHKKLVDALEEDWMDEVDFYFVEGFKLGLLIGIECAEK